MKQGPSYVKTVSLAQNESLKESTSDKIEFETKTSEPKSNMDFFERIELESKKTEADIIDEVQSKQNVYLQVFEFGIF